MAVSPSALKHPDGLPPTARVILGFLAGGPKSGYDVKTFVDRSTRFFWAASYGQIYPELRRLASSGLVEPTGHSQGGRRRTEYAITQNGREVLEGWLRAPDQTYELRDEGLLKLFFAGHLGSDEVRAVLEARRDRHRGFIARLREIEPWAMTAERYGPLQVLHYGLELHEHTADWCERMLAELGKEND